ncbi:MAG: SBBP repeat-containing protein [Parvularculaceae bacterium]|nr:SBBP repeat-containing protein [Parvularculaceae bacterium]
MTLTWTGGSQFTGYRIYRNDVQIGTTTSTTFTDTGLSAVTAYRYFVRGETASGLSSPSGTITLTTPNMLALSLSKLLDPASRSNMLVRDIEFDSAGNIFVTGGALSASFPTTAGAYDRTFGSGGSSAGSFGPSDAFVMKFNRSGQLLWSTLIGGPNHDRAYGLEIAPDGGIVIAGRAGEGFPTTAGVIQPTFAGDTNPNAAYGKQDGFIAKISADGSTLLWSTYFGENNYGFLRDVAVDSNNKVYVAGPFFAGLAHITPSALQSAPNGQHDLVYARLNATATTVEYGTYLGGNEPANEVAAAPSIIVTPNRDVYLTIVEGGNGAPTTSTAYQKNNAGGKDFLIARFNASDQLVYATYLGGSSGEDLETHNIAVDGSGRLAIAGTSSSSNYPTKTDAYQPAFGGGSADGVVSILSADGSTLVASTFLGGTGREEVQGIEFAPDGLLYVSGGSTSSSLKTTSNAFQKSAAGGADAILAAFLPSLKGAPYLSYFGGSNDEQSNALAIASDGAVAFCGETASSNFPVTGGGSTAPSSGETGWWTLLQP